MPTDVRKGAVVEVSTEVLHGLLKLPEDIRISRIISEFDDDMHGTFRIFISGSGLSEIYSIEEGSTPRKAQLLYRMIDGEGTFDGVVLI